MDNGVHQQPNYSAHRRGVAASDPVMPGFGTPAWRKRGALNAKGWNSLYVVAEAAAGSIEVEPLLVVKKDDGSEDFVPLPVTGPHGVNSPFLIPNVNQGRVYLRVHAHPGSPVVLRVAGAERANEGSL